MDSHDMTTLRPVEELIEAYPEGVAEAAMPGVAYGDLAQEAASTVALGARKPVRDRCIACGLREEAFSEPAAAHHDFVSAQAHFDAARARSKPDEASKQRRAELASLRREMAFYLTTPSDSERLARIRKRGDLVADVRALVQLIRPRRTLILDPSFKEEWLDVALALAEAEEKARAARAVEAAMKRRRVQLRLVRDRTVARVMELLGEIRMYGRHVFRTDATQPLHLPPDDLVTHAVVLGMTGSGKTGLLMVLVEEAVRSSIPVVIIDIKGDLPNLLLTFPRLSASI